MVNKIFGLRDNVAHRFIDMSYSPNHACFIREFAISLCGKYPLRDLTLCELGEINMCTGKITVYDCPIERDWSDYKLPETRAEALAPLGADISQQVVEFERQSIEAMKKGDNE